MYIGGSYDRFGGFSYRAVITPTVSTSPAYSAGDNIGAATLTLTEAARQPAGSGLLNGVTLIDADNNKKPVQVFILTAAYSTGADNAAFDYTNNIANIAASFNVASTDWVTVGTRSVASVRGLGIAYLCAATSFSLYLALADVAGGITFTNAANLKVCVGLLRD
jgi:hypothetical protein